MRSSTTYADTFWGGDLSSTAGYEALAKRNHESKKVCSELEEYFKKRSKLEQDYSKSLSNLAKNFKERDQIGVLEATLNKIRCELEVIAGAHTKAADLYSQQADSLEKFRKEQTINRKSVEDMLSKSQSAKSSQLSKTKQLEKTYVRRYQESEAMEANLREIYTSPGANPEKIEKIRIKAQKASEEVTKADEMYKSAVLVLEDCRESWEREMIAACNAIQQLDEERITFLREELWKAVNTHSQTALDVDTSCEGVREILEKCDVVSDIDAFIHARGTGTAHPEPFVYRHYSKLVNTDNDSCGSSEDSSTTSNVYSDASSPPPADAEPASAGKNKKTFTFSRGFRGMKK